MRSLPALAAEDLQLPDFFVEPLLTPDSTAVIFGPREAGKTQFVLTLFKALQEEELLFGRYQCHRTKAVLIEVDMPLIQMQRRVRQAMQHFAFSPDLFRVVDLRKLDLIHANPKEPWLQDLQAFAPGIVIFDSLRKCHPLDENDTATPSKVYNAARQLFPDACRCFLHHVGKPPMRVQQGDTMREVDESYRGTTAWLDDADTGLLLQRKGKTRTFQVTRGRHTDEDVKQDITPITFNEESLLLEATDSGLLAKLYLWLAEHRGASRADAMAWLAEACPERTARSHRRACAVAFADRRTWPMSGQTPLSGA